MRRNNVYKNDHNLYEGRIIMKTLSVLLILTLILPMIGCQITETTTPFLTPELPVTISPTVQQEEWVTYIQFGSGYAPISYIVNGTQQLSGRCECEKEHAPYDCPQSHEWISTVYEKVAHAPSAATITKIDAAEMYATNSVPFYASQSIFDSVASNVTWNLFPSKVLYEVYTLDDQPSHAEWLSFFQEKLTVSGINSPIIFTDSWSFNWNGIQAALVNASNFIVTGDQYVTPSSPSADNFTVYSLSVLFIEGRQPIALDCDGPRQETAFLFEHSTISKEPLSSANDLSFLPPEDNGMFYEQIYSTIQYDEHGGLKECPIFNCGEFWGPRKLVMLLCDTDGDGETELILFMLGSIYNPILVYELGNHELTEVFRLPTGA